MKYAALLRGIGPGNPNMQNVKLRSVFEGLGFKKVQSVISSGNIIFETGRTDVKAMEAELEAACESQLNFTSTTIIRSSPQLRKLLNLQPFAGLTHSPSSYLLVTFGKQPFEVPFALPYQPPRKTYTLLGATRSELFTVTDNTAVKTTDLMTWLEKQFGKQITSRTWKTMERVVARMAP